MSSILRNEGVVIRRRRRRSNERRGGGGGGEEDEEEVLERRIDATQRDATRRISGEEMERKGRRKGDGH